MSKSYKELMNSIQTFILDIDGVLTDGYVHVKTNGDLERRMNIKDGYALKTAINKGYAICIISGGSNEGVRKRLENLGLTDIYLGVHDKLPLLHKYTKDKGISLEDCIYMGDDIPDLPAMQVVGLPCCPKDAVPEIQNAALYISDKNGGAGCVRDVIEQVLKVQGKWLNDYTAKYD